MGDAKNRKELDPNFGKVSRSRENLFYSTQALPESLADSLKGILKDHSEINENNWESIYESVSSLVVDNFLGFSKTFSSEKEILIELASFYHDRCSTVSTFSVDYPYYLISLFYRIANKISLKREEIIERELKSRTYFELLHELIEQLLVLMPRDVAKGVRLYIVSGKSFVSIYINKNKEIAQAILNHDYHFERYLKTFDHVGYNVWTRPFHSLSWQNSPLSRIQIITNFDGSRGSIKLLLFDFSSFALELEKFSVEHVDKIQTALSFVFVELFGYLSTDELQKVSFRNCL